MKVSIVTAILNSHEVVRRQLLHYKRMNLPDDVEVIFVDDGSDPPLENSVGLKNFALYATNDTRDWTQPAARNFGVGKAVGEYLLCVDIDHIVCKPLIEFIKANDYDVIRFSRQSAVIDENGDFTQDMGVLRSYGLKKAKWTLPPHANSFAIKRQLYLDLGGVSEKHVGSGKHPNREEVQLKRRVNSLVKMGKITICNDRTKPIIYHIPNGRFCGELNYNPFGLFHNLKRSTMKR